MFIDFNFFRKRSSTSAIFLTASRLAPLSSLLVVLLLLACPAQADGTVVTGTGTPGQDVPNVQAAVDKGGLVQLRGKFNFGPNGRVRITKNVRIQGQADSIGEPKTTITGGFWTFYAPLPVKGAPPADKGPIISVRAIRFDGAKSTPLHFPHVGGLDVRGCTVTDVIPQPVDIPWSDGDTLPFQAGIVVGNRIDYPKAPLKRAVTGTVRIEDNRFLMENNRPEGVAGYGVVADWTWGAEITIARNTIHRSSRNGIEVLDNVRSDKGKGSIDISGNRITTDEEGIAWPHKFGPNGIVAGWYFDTSGGADFSRNNRIAVTGTASRDEARIPPACCSTPTIWWLPATTSSWRRNRRARHRPDRLARLLRQQQGARPVALRHLLPCLRKAGSHCQHLCLDRPERLYRHQGPGFFSGAPSTSWWATRRPSSTRARATVTWTSCPAPCPKWTLKATPGNLWNNSETSPPSRRLRRGPGRNKSGHQSPVPAPFTAPVTSSDQGMKKPDTQSGNPWLTTLSSLCID